MVLSFTSVSLCFVVALCCTSVTASSTTGPPLRSTPCEVVQFWGYPCEDHTVQTSDGYILSLQRIPKNIGDGTKVAFLQHGLFDSSFTWMVNGPSDSLSFMMADAGFDVWLGNTRGNRYSDTNVNFSNDTDDFWAFSWDQMASIDLPAMLQYVHSQTAESATVTYIGHSQGTMIGFAEYEIPSVADQVDLFVAIAPVAYVANLGLPVYHEVSLIPESILYAILGNRSILDTPKAIDDFTSMVCKFIPTSCEGIICILAGCESSSNVNATVLPLLLSNFPSGTSVQNLMHYSQGTNDDAFQMFDYGSATSNQEHYRQPTPPQYNASLANVPTMIIHGGLDKLADPTDVAKLLPMLPNVVSVCYIADYGHGDFVWSSNAKTVIYEPLIQNITAFIKTITPSKR